MTTTGEAVTAPARPRRTLRRVRRWALGIGLLVAVLALLFGVPWWVLAGPGPAWPAPVAAAGAVAFAAGAVALPVLLVSGHRAGGSDRAARAGDTLLGVSWVLFAWSVLGLALWAVLAAAGVPDPGRSRFVAAAVLVVAVALLAWGYAEAMRVPRIRPVTVPLERLGTGLDGLRVVLLTDTHYGPIDRTTWSERVVDAVNALEPDLVVHTGDLADGTVARRRGQIAPLSRVRARLARAYVTGNHEYFGAEATAWLDHMRELGWEALHNRHLTLERNGARLVVAGVDDRTAAGSGQPGQGADHAAALAGADPDAPVILLAHQPKQVGAAVDHRVDLQLSGHTHGGQIWPFHLLVRLDQPTVQGLRRYGPRTQLYTSRGTGFWGPPLRIFAPSEITLLTLRAEAAAA